MKKKIIKKKNIKKCIQNVFIERFIKVTFKF